MRIIRAAVSAALFLFAGVTAGVAQDVTLTSQDGAVTIAGTLLGFDGEFYRVETQYGELTVDGSGVNCEGVGCPNLATFIAEMRMSGSSVIATRVMPLLVEAFARASGLSARREDEGGEVLTYALSDPAQDRTVARFSFDGHTTEEGFADLLADEADVVMALRGVRPGEARLAREAGLGNLREPNRSRVLALDGLVPVVAPGNPIQTISLPVLARVLSGEITNWAQLGGEDAQLDLYVPADGSGLAQSMADRILAPARKDLTDTAEQLNTNRDLVNRVANDPVGIGIASYANLGNAKPLTLTGDCGFSLAASRQTIKTEDYPLTAPMFLYLPARRLPKLARDFLSYTRSPLAQIVIRRAGLVDQAHEEIALNAQGDRLVNAVSVAGPEFDLKQLQAMITRLQDRKRLSVSFRFEVGSSRLDAQSNSNVQQLARALEGGRYDTRDLLFVGFSDGNGDAGGNRLIAQRRADAVLKAVQNAAETADFSRLTLGSDAFGEMLPMACDDTTWGRSVNRRVEVWIK